MDARSEATATNIELLCQGGLGVHATALRISIVGFAQRASGAMNRTKTADFLTWFTLREETLLNQARERHLALPERLQNWRLWIQDPTLYLHELAGFLQNPPGTAPEPDGTEGSPKATGRHLPAVPR